MLSNFSPTTFLVAELHYPASFCNTYRPAVMDPFNPTNNLLACDLTILARKANEWLPIKANLPDAVEKKLIEQDARIRDLEAKLSLFNDVNSLVKSLQNKIVELERRSPPVGYHRFTLTVDAPFKRHFQMQTDTDRRNTDAFYPSKEITFEQVGWFLLVKLNKDGTVGIFLSPANSPSAYKVNENLRIKFRFAVYGDADDFLYEDSYVNEFKKDEVFGCGANVVPHLKDRITNTVTVILDMKKVL